MKFSKNEERVLKILLHNAKTPDASIAKKLKISSQAVGKIRKKLEKTVIKSYNIEIDYSKVGIHLFAISLAKITPEGKDHGELELEQKMLEIPEIIQIYRLPTGEYTHILFYAFKDIDDLDQFFHTKVRGMNINNYIENKQIFPFSNYNLIKNNPQELFKKIISETKNKKENKKYKEIEYFKKRM